MGTYLRRPQPVIKFCLSCQEPGPLWCLVCASKLTPVDRWYLIGYYDTPAGFLPPRNPPWQSDIFLDEHQNPWSYEECKASYDMGVADRKGVSDE